MNTEFKAILFDIDGVLEFQGRDYPGAPELLDFLRRKGIIIRILTNSTLKSRKHCVAKLTQRGFHVRQEEVITASYATAKYLKTLSPKSCWVMLDGKGIEEFEGLHFDPDSPEYIVVGDYRQGFNFENMNKALKLLLAGAKLIVMIPEKVDHSLGSVELTVGAVDGVRELLDDGDGMAFVAQAFGEVVADAAKTEAVLVGTGSYLEIFPAALAPEEPDADEMVSILAQLEELGE